MRSAIDSGLWGPVAASGRPALPRPPSSSRVQLAPLSDDFRPASMLQRDEASLFPPSPDMSASRRPGHVGMMRAMRHSLPAAVRDFSREAGTQEAVRASWPPGAQAPTGLGCSRPPTGDRITFEAAPQGSRPRKSSRTRRVIDISTLSQGAAGARGHSCAAAPQASRSSADASESGAAFSPPQAAPTASQRSASVPAGGATQASPEERARAVARLQQLFFEEMRAGGGQDANGAAARALLRLNEQQAASRASSPCAGSRPPNAAPFPTMDLSRARPEATPSSASSSVVPAGSEVPRAPVSPAGPAPAVAKLPRRPAPLGDGSRRRPSPLVRVAVQN